MKLTPPPLVYSSDVIWPRLINIFAEATSTIVLWSQIFIRTSRESAIRFKPVYLKGHVCRQVQELWTENWQLVQKIESLEWTETGDMQFLTYAMQLLRLLINLLVYVLSVRHCFLHWNICFCCRIFMFTMTSSLANASVVIFLLDLNRKWSGSQLSLLGQTG